MADWKNVHLAEQDKEIEALRARVEKLEWLVEVQAFYMHRLRNPGGWAPVGCDRGLLPVFWTRRSASLDELHVTYRAALSDCADDAPKGESHE